MNIVGKTHLKPTLKEYFFVTNLLIFFIIFLYNNKLIIFYIISLANRNYVRTIEDMGGRRDALFT